MTVATSIIIVAMIGSIGLGVFDKNSNEQIPDNQPIAISKEIKSESTEVANISEATKKEESQNVFGKTIKVKTEQNTLIKGMNTITLSDEELKEFGIFYDTYKDDDIVFQCIKFADKSDDSSYHYYEFIFYRDNCPKIVFIKGHFDSSKKFLRIKPFLVSDKAEGGNGVHYGKYNGDNNDFDDFIQYQRKLFDLYELSFRASTDFSNLPKNVLDCISNLSQLFDNYHLGSKESIDKNNQIQSDLNNIYNFFKKIFLKEKDTKYLDTIKIYTEKRDSLVQVIITDNVKNPEHLKAVDKLTGDNPGQKFVLDWPTIVDFKTIFSNVNKVLEQKLSEIKNVIEKSLRINNMIALHVLFKNDPQNGVTFWFLPSLELINALPERYRKDLSYEFKLIENNEPFCGAPIDIEKAYLDVWRTCSGAIENLRIFPNPVKDFLNIKFELKENREITFVVHDLTGRKVKDVSKTEYYNSGTISVSLNLSNILQGMYYIVAKSNSNEQVMQRFIKE